MSDLISTPSRTQSPVSNEAFEALIDLLASDGIDQGPSKPAGNHTRPQANMTLRDPSGKLDFDKIRLMFAAQNESHCASSRQAKRRVQSPTVLPREDGDSDDEPHSHRSACSTAPSRSHSPKPVERSSAGHRRSSTFGNQPWAAIHENAAKDEMTPMLSRQPLSFDELNTALAGAHEEVRSLRQQYDELRALVAKRLGTEIRDQAKPCPSGGANAEKVAPDKGNGRDETSNAGSQARPGISVPPTPPIPDPDVPTEIADLSEKEAKRALSALAHLLNLSLSDLPGLSTLSLQPNLLPSNPARQHDVASIARAVKFLGTVDELVWRRTSAPSGPRTLLPVYSEENIVALVARLELWERAVRRSSRT